MPRTRTPFDVLEVQPSERDDVPVNDYRLRGQDSQQYRKVPVEIDYEVEHGSTGLKRQQGFVYEEFLKELNGKRAIHVYKEMRDNDAVVGAFCFAIEMLLRKVEWRVDPFSDSEGDKESADFVRECMDDMSHDWADMVAEICSMIWYGFSTHEVVYKMRRGPDQEDSRLRSKFGDGKIGWRKIPIRSQDSWDEWHFDDEGGLLGWWQRPWPDFVERYIPIEKALLFRTTSTKNNPEGRSCLRNAYRSWYFKKRLQESEGIGVERDLAGLPMISLPAEFFEPNANEKKKATLASFRKLLEQIRSDSRAGILMPMEYDEKNNPLYEFSLVTSGGTRMFDTSSIIKRYNEEIAMVVLADFILLGGNDSPGSWALATSKTGLFQSSLSALADNIAQTFNRHAIPKLFSLNGMPMDRLPKIAHEEVDAPSLEELGSYIQALTAAGWGDMLSDTDLRNFLRKRGRLPIPADEAGGEDIDDSNAVLPGHTPGKENLIFAGPTGVVTVSPDGKADIQSAATQAPPPGADTGQGAPTPPQKSQGAPRGRERPPPTGNSKTAARAGARPQKRPTVKKGRRVTADV